MVGILMEVKCVSNSRLNHSNGRRFFPSTTSIRSQGEIYKILSSASPEYAAWLHDKGYISPIGKPVKLFVFSKLTIPRMVQCGNTLIQQAVMAHAVTANHKNNAH